MKKSLLQKPIKTRLLEIGFEHVKNDDYAILSGDRKTKILLRIPSGKNGHGFVLGALFSDMGVFDGTVTNAIMRQYDYAHELAFPETNEYTEEQIENVLNRLLEDYQPYISEGASAIKDHLDKWTYGVSSEKERDLVLRYFGFPGIDPYSEEYQRETVASINGGMIVISLTEYREHKAFYDGYKTYDCYHVEIDIDETHDRVRISFHQKAVSV